MSGVRCEGCGGTLRYHGETCYTCSPAGWMAAYQRRSRGQSQNDGYAAAVRTALDAGERRQAVRGTYRRIRAESADEAAVARALATRGEDLAVIARAQGRLQGHSAGEISRSAAAAAARAPGAERCSGPDCPICAYGRQQGLR
jgi:hypothetical protein